MVIFTAVILAFVVLAFAAWRRYLWAAQIVPAERVDDSPYGLTDYFGGRQLVNVPHQAGVRWLTEVFSNSARTFPHLTALQVPHIGESLTYAELEDRAEHIADCLAPFLDGPDQVVAVAMPQDNWQIVATHLAVLKAGGVLMFLDTSLPDSLVEHMLQDADPVVVVTRGRQGFRDLPTLNVLALPDHPPARFRWRRLQHRVLRAEGPERIEPEWWREGSDGMTALARDYFRVEDSEGRRYWLYRAGDRWFLHGLFG